MTRPHLTLLAAGSLALASASPVAASDYTLPLSCDNPSGLQHVVDHGGAGAVCSGGDGSPITATGSALLGTLSDVRVEHFREDVPYTSVTADYKPPASPTTGTDTATLEIHQGSRVLSVTQKFVFNTQAGGFPQQLDTGLKALKPVQKGTKLTFKAPASAFPGGSTVAVSLTRFGKSIGSRKATTVAGRRLSIPVKLTAGVRKLLKTQGVNANVSTSATNPFDTTRTSHSAGYKLRLKELRRRHRH